MNLNVSSYWIYILAILCFALGTTFGILLSVMPASVPQPTINPVPEQIGRYRIWQETPHGWSVLDCGSMQIVALFPSIEGARVWAGERDAESRVKEIQGIDGSKGTGIWTFGPTMEQRMYDALTKDPRYAEDPLTKKDAGKNKVNR